MVTVPVTPGATVKVVLLMVAGSIASLNVAVITVFGHTPAAPTAGATETTVGGGGGGHEVGAVVKVHTKLLASALPNSSFAPVVIVTVYRVLSWRLPDGVKVNMVLDASGVTVPITPGVTVKVVALIVAGSIACGKVAATTMLGHTPAEPLGGVTEIGGGGGLHGFAPVEKIHAKSAARALPNMS